MRAAVINVFAKEKLWENTKLDMHIIIFFIFFLTWMCTEICQYSNNPIEHS